MRPAVLDAVRRMLTFYGLETSAQIVYNGNNETTELLGARTNEPYGTAEYTDGVYRNKLYVVAEFEDSDFNSGDANQRREMTERPVWMGTEDEPTMVMPAFEGMKVNVGLVAGFNSENLAERFVKKIRRLQSQQVTAMNFSATVHFGVEESILELLENIYLLNYKNDPVNNPGTFLEWFQVRQQAPFKLIRNAAGNNHRVVVPRRLDDIGIYFEQPKASLARKAQILGKYEVEVKFYFYFNKFIGWELEYPLNVYQDQIDEKWIPRPQAMYKQPFNIRVAPEMAMIFPYTNNRHQHHPYFLKLPDYDPWVMTKQSWVRPIIQARLALKDEPRQVLFNIFTDIPGFEWNEHVKQYMLRRHEYAFQQYYTPFPIMVFSNDLRVDPRDLEMDETGTISLLRAPWMDRTYRVVITMDYAIRDYSKGFWDDLNQNQDDWGLLPNIFIWYDWSQIQKPYAAQIPKILREIDKGRGHPPQGITAYMMDMDLNAYTLLKDRRYE